MEETISAFEFVKIMPGLIERRWVGKIICNGILFHLRPRGHAKFQKLWKTLLGEKQQQERESG